MTTHSRNRFIVATAAVGLLAACDQPTEVSQDFSLEANITAPIAGEDDEVMVCKHGPAGVYQFKVTAFSNATLQNVGATDSVFSLTADADADNDGPECLAIASSLGNGVITVQETATPNSDVQFLRTDIYTIAPTGTETGASPVATGGNPTTFDGFGDRGAVIVFVNAQVAPPEGEGRMTGGGGVDHPGDLYLTYSLTIHCDIILSNNIQINWPDNKWHLDKPITSASCLDDPTIDQKPPQAPLDTFVGEGVGRLNGVHGYTLNFTFVDGGEPGHKVDKVQLLITAPNGSVVLDLPLMITKNGNIQAHFDQPHK